MKFFSSDNNKQEKRRRKRCLCFGVSEEYVIKMNE